MPSQNTNKQIGAAVMIALLIGLVLVLCLPIAFAIIDSIGSANADDFTAWINATRAWILLRSVAIAGLIAAMAMLFGLPLSVVLGSKNTRASALLIAPIWMPSVLVYLAFNLIRSPETMIGDRLIEMAASGHRWAPIWAGYLLSALGLALWALPIGAVLLAFGRTDQSGALGLQLRLEPLGVIGKLRLWIGAQKGLLLRVWVILVVLFLGSAVPMHLAQFETWSIVLWRELAQRAPDQWAMVWIGSIPMILAACIGAWMVTRTIGAIDQSSSMTISESVAPSPPPKRIQILAWVIWVLAVGVPMAAMLWSIKDPKSIVQFWRISAEGLRSSGAVAGLAGLAAIVVAALVCFAIGHPSSMVRRIGKTSLFLLFVLGLFPGVLIGAAVAQSPVKGHLAVVLAICMRTCCIGAVVGGVIAASEPGSRRAMRWLEGSVGPTDWWSTVLRGSWMPMLGCSVAAGLVALYEIEASVMVRPPGMSNLAQQMLSDLHFTRLERLSAAGINMLGIGVLVGTLATGLIRKSNPRID